MSEQFDGNVTTRYRCMECGKDCAPREFHDFVECVRYRWTKAPRAADDEAGELRRCESDLKSLLAAIDQWAPAPRRYPS